MMDIGCDYYEDNDGSSNLCDSASSGDYEAGDNESSMLEDDVNSCSSDSVSIMSGGSDYTYCSVIDDDSDSENGFDGEEMDASDITQHELQSLIDDAAISPTKVPAFFVADETYNDSDEDESSNVEDGISDIQKNLNEVCFQHVAEEKSPPKKRSRENPITKKGTSILNDSLLEKKVIWISFDIETGGPRCGIIQLSAVFMDQNGVVIGNFDSYCKPSAGAVFLQQACECHGIFSRKDDRLTMAPSISTVWNEFCKKVKEIFMQDKYKEYVGVLVAWNGKACDLEWIYKLINSVTETDCSMPNEIKYFMDPYQVIKKYKGCELNPCKSNIPNLKLTTVYEHVQGKPLHNAHNSLYDCEGQCLILMSDKFKPYWNKTNSIITIESIWSAKDKNRMKYKQELIVQPHQTWKADDDAENWSPPASKQFTGFAGGATPGTSKAVKDILGTVNDPYEALAILFRFFIDDTLLEHISRESNRYAFDDTVEKQVMDDNGVPRKKKILVPCPEDSPLKRKRVQSQSKKDVWKFTSGYILAWIGICIYWGGLSSKQSPDIMWMSLANGGVYVPMVRNTMPKNAFHFARQYIHFADNSAAKNHSDDPLYKIRHIVKKISEKLKLGWNANIALSVDESMIKYKGRSIKFVQYMPKKPIKHGIKVFCLCDADTGYLLAFEVYTGEKGSSTCEIIQRLILQSGLQNETGRRLFMDNYYTTMKVVTTLYEEYGWVCAGTVVLTKKKTEKREVNDFPFSKISKPATAMVDRGWSRSVENQITLPFPPD